MYKYSNIFILFYQHKLCFYLFLIVFILIPRKKDLSQCNTNKSCFICTKIKILDLEEHQSLTFLFQILTLTGVVAFDLISNFGLDVFLFPVPQVSIRPSQLFLAQIKFSVWFSK